MTRAARSSTPHPAAPDPFTVTARRDPLDPFRGAAFAGGHEVATRTHATRREET